MDRCAFMRDRIAKRLLSMREGREYDQRARVRVLVSWVAKFAGHNTGG
jgi:hypothetical protein